MQHPTNVTEKKVPEKKDKTNKVFLLASFHLYFVTFRQRNCRGGAGAGAGAGGGCLSQRDCTIRTERVKRQSGGNLPLRFPNSQSLSISAFF
jgi:hypothetical protein